MDCDKLTTSEVYFNVVEHGTKFYSKNDYFEQRNKIQRFYGDGLANFWVGLKNLKQDDLHQRDFRPGSH